MRTQANEQIAEQGRFALEQVLLRVEALRVTGELEESLTLAGVDSQAGSDPVRSLAWRHRRELIDDRTIAASVLGDRHDRDDVLAVSLDRDGGPRRRAISLLLVEIADTPDEIGLDVGHRLLHGEAEAAAHDDVGTTVGERREGHDLRFGPDRVRLGGRADVLAGADQGHAERAVLVHAAPHQEAVTRLEDVQRQQHLGEQDGGERKERKQLRHRLNGTLRSVMASKAADYPVEDIVAAVDTPATIGIALVGSLARGTATRWSDIDVHRYVRDDASRPPNIVRWVTGRLLRANTTTPREVRQELARPETAVWAVEPTRTMRILVDREGQLALIQSAALAFDWSQIAEAANEWVSQRVSKDAENVLKLRGAVDGRDESSILNAHLNLALHCTEASCIALGVLITSENRFHEQVRKAAGPIWTNAQRAAYGLDGGDIFARAVATCALYEATVTLLTDHLDSPALEVAARAIAVMPR
jgi:hypothetical protein